ncbi:hypothetical protein BC833DRAFT_265611 [Globomyces pollinis-pini]|nr:hypothetical protein BC833DRAFT_265611 [Globomyces pollinis-pini]
MGCDCHANCPYHQLDKNNELSKDCSKFIRIIDDLEISNNSLLHINMSLEDTVRHQALIIEKLQRNLKKLSDDDTIVPTVVDSKANSVIQNDRHSLAYEVLSQKQHKRDCVQSNYRTVFGHLLRIPNKLKLRKIGGSTHHRL